MRKLLARAALMLLLAACPFPSASGQRFPADPVEKLRSVLVDDYRVANNILSRVDPRPSPTAIDMALRQYREKLFHAIEGNKATGERGLGNSSSVLSRALLLIEWNRSGRSVGTSPVDAINNAARGDLLAKFVKAVNQGLKSSQPALQIAQANLISETLASSGTQADNELNAVLGKTADNLLELTKRSTDTEVQIAGARALSRFYGRTRTAAEAWKHLLQPTQPESVRRAAAESLENMLVVTNGIDRLEASQPGVSTRVGLASKPLLIPEELADMATDLLPVAGLAAGDRAAAVRLAGVRSLRESAVLVESVIKVESGRIKDLIGKRLTPADLEALEPTVEVLRAMNKVFKEFAQRREILLSELSDPDPRIRTEARRALAMIAQFRAEAVELERVLREIDRDNDGLLQRKRIKGKDRPKEADKQARRDPSRPEGTLRLIGGADAPPPSTMIAAAPSVGAGGDKRDDLPPPGTGPFLNELDGLDATLKSLAQRLSVLSRQEQELAARRATAQALEALAELAHPYIDTLQSLLADRDLIVRWIAARTLGKMGEKAAPAVQALIALVDDEDQDVRIVGLDSLGKIGPKAQAAVPAAIRRLTQGDAEVRLAAIEALEGIGLGSAPALPTLVALFQHEDYRVRAAAAKLVGRFEAKARVYVPQLRKLVDDRDASVRGAASAAILAIGE
ncbi:MAG: HEAT repeat domain-containing protein [Gemmataceae bacterium]